MKKCISTIILLSMLLMMSACSKEETKITVLYHDKNLVIDTTQKTLAYNDDIYHYNIDGSRTTIEYPDGSSYWWETVTEDNRSGYGGWSDDYSEAKYIPGSDLVNMLPNDKEKGGSKNLFLFFLMFALGVWNIVSPYQSWYLSYGWRYKDAEPSDTALVLRRISGIAAIIIAFLYLVL